MPSYKPSGYTSVAPYLVVDGASRTIDFLVKAFGATELRRFPEDKRGGVRDPGGTTWWIATKVK